MIHFILLAEDYILYIGKQQTIIQKSFSVKYFVANTSTKMFECFKHVALNFVESSKKRVFLKPRLSLNKLEAQNVNGKSHRRLRSYLRTAFPALSFENFDITHDRLNL